MALNIPGIKNPIFKQSKIDDRGIGQQKETSIKFFSIAGQNFQSTNPDTDTVTRLISGIRADTDGIVFFAPVILPDGAEVKEAIVFGNTAAAAGETWTFERVLLATGGSTTLASGNIEIVDTSINSPIMNNETHAFWFKTSSFDTNDQVTGGRIKYEI